MRSSFISVLTAFLYCWGIQSDWFFFFFLKPFYGCVESGRFGLLSNENKHSWDLLLTQSSSHSLGFKIAQVGIKKIHQMLIFLLGLFKWQVTYYWVPTYLGILRTFILVFQDSVGYPSFFGPFFVMLHFATAQLTPK